MRAASAGPAMPPASPTPMTMPEVARGLTVMLRGARVVARKADAPLELLQEYDAFLRRLHDLNHSDFARAIGAMAGFVYWSLARAAEYGERPLDALLEIAWVDPAEVE